MYTSSSVFLKALAEAGITHAFVNWGSDHPAILEDLERQRVEGGQTAIQIVTSPNEMVALSAAQGYAQVTGKPAAVLVHVDVGTQVRGLGVDQRLVCDVKPPSGHGGGNSQCRPKPDTCSDLRRCFALQ